jgi:hypothetical protein
VKIRSRKDACAGRRCIIEIDCVNLNGPRYVLEILPTKLPAADRNFPLNLIENLAGNTNASAVGDAFQASRDVDAITEDVVLIDHYVANIDAKPKINATILGQTNIPFSHSLLNCQSAANGINCAGELNQRSVAGRFNDASVMLSNVGIDDFATMRFQGRQSAFLINAHQSAVTRDVGCEDGCQPSHYAPFDHAVAPAYFSALKCTFGSWGRPPRLAVSVLCRKRIFALQWTRSA